MCERVGGGCTKAEPLGRWDGVEDKGQKKAPQITRLKESQAVMEWRLNRFMRKIASGLTSGIAVILQEEEEVERSYICRRSHV